MAGLWRDLRSALGALRRSPAATLVAVLTLALAMGALTAIFSLLNAVVLRSLPVPHAEQLAGLATTIPDNVNGDQSFTLPMFLELRRQNQVFSSLFAWTGGWISGFEADGGQYAAAAATVSGDYYRTMQIAPLLGRFIDDSDVALEAGTSRAVAVVSYRVWRRWYRGDPHILGKIIRIGTQPFTIIGVEPEGYSGLIIDGSADVTVPIFAPGQGGQSYDFRGPKILWLHVYGRLKPAVSLAAARASLQALWPHILEATAPSDYSGEKQARFFARRLVVESAATGISFLRKRFSDSLRVLLALAGAVLLIACLNLANLSLARVAARRHESGIRAALGASTWDLMRQPLAESILLSAAGALLGLWIAGWAGAVLIHIVWTGTVVTPLSTSPDLRVFAFTAAVCLATAALFAIAPAWHAARTSPMDALKQQTRSVRGEATRLRKLLLVAQMALSLMLVVAALLLGRTITNLHTADAGYQRDRLLTMILFPQAGRNESQNSVAYYRELVDALEKLPGVEDVSFSGAAPGNEMEYFESVYPSPGASPVQAVDEAVAPDFFKVVGMHVLSGREFTWQDRGAGIISQSLAERLFGHDDPVGRTIYFGPHAHLQPLRVVGVVTSASLWKVESYHPMAIYRPLAAEFPNADPLMSIRTTVDPKTLKTAAQRAVRALGHQYSLRTATVEERLDSFLSVQRVTALLASFFGFVAILIGAAGLYGLMSFHVTRRTGELGVRVALGARRSQILALVLRDVFLLAGSGCALGVSASLAAGRLIRGILFGVAATDLTVLASGVAILLVVALVAGWVPAGRAAKIDPVEALRAE